MLTWKCADLRDKKPQRRKPMPNNQDAAKSQPQVGTTVLLGFALILWAVCLPICLTHIMIRGTVNWWAGHVEPMEGYMQRELVLLVWIALILLTVWAIFSH